MVDNFKTEKFVNGICDPDIKLEVCFTQKSTFAETVAFALAQETARKISRPQVSKVQKIKVVEEEEYLSNKFKEMLKQVLDKLDKRLNLNASTVKRVTISKKIVKHRGKGLTNKE